MAGHLPANLRPARRPWLSITAKLALVFVLFAAALMVSVGALAYRNGRDALHQVTTGELISTASEKAAALDSWVAHDQLVAELRTEVAIGGAYLAFLVLDAEDGRLLAVLAGRLNLAEMEAIITRDSDLYQSSEAFLINSAGQFVTQPSMLADPVVLQRTINTEASQRCSLPRR